MAGIEFSYPHLLQRWLMAMLIVFATYNPSGYSYAHWLIDLDDQRWSLKVLVGTGLLILHLTFVFATFRALRSTGLLVAVAFFVALIWTIIDNGYLTSLGVRSWISIILGIFATILAIGVSWSYIRGRLSGQADSNDITL
ncbi:MAG: DUF6524 family protein [Alphaproteobacteria bacterium]